MAKNKPVKLNVYLLKKGYSLADTIVEDGKMSESSVEIPNGGPGLLYINRSSPRPPTWADFLEPLDEDAISKLKVATVSAIVVLKAGDRFFAACFGHGYAYVEKRFVESRFGLRTCLNAVDPQTIRTLDKRTFDSLGKLSREQSTRPVTISEFGLEVDKDLLRSIVGKPRDEGFGSQIAGKDSVCVRVPITIAQLPKFLRKCLKESKKTDYKANFEFIDNIAEISDPDLKQELDVALIEAINDTPTTHKIWLAVPDIVDWEASAGFKYSTSKKEHCVDDIRLSTFQEKWEITGDVTKEHLKGKKVYQFNSAETAPLNSWSVYHCLYAEITSEGRLYILTEGTWYHVAQDFVKNVEKEVKALPTYAKPLEKWGDEHEDQYNKRIATKSKGQYALMDRKMIRHGGGSSSIEFCDLFSTDKEIIHVKHYSGSSVLSHLFHQGTVSAVMTAGDPEFRNKVNAKLPASHKLPLDGTFQASDYEVVYAIATREPLSFDLPFFSKVSLRNAFRELRVSGYRVSLAKIRRTKLAKIT